MKGSKLDDLDRRIVKALNQDGRMSNRQIATDLGVTEGTIRSRIKRLQKEGLIQFTVVTSFRAAGSPNLVMFGITCDPSCVSALSTQLAAIPLVGCVMTLIGRYNILAMGLFTSVEQVHELVTTQIKPLPGVRDVEVSISIHSLKYDARMARIVPRDVDQQSVEG